MTTLIYQSYRTRDVPGWIVRALDSVRDWAAARGYRYEFIDDRIFDVVPDWYRERAGEHVTIVTDLARLLLARSYLANGFERVVWIDADVLVFDAENFDVPLNMRYAFCKEIWVTHVKGRLTQRGHVHNAVALFHRDNPILDFYIHACMAMVKRTDLEQSPAVVGTDFLTELYRMLRFPLLTNVGLFSPLVLRDIAAGGGTALKMQRHAFGDRIQAANLCASFAGRRFDGVEVDEALFDRVVEVLLETGGAIVNRS